LKKHILSSHIGEYEQLKAEFPDRTFYDIFKELRTNNKFPFVDFKFFDSTNDLTNNQENINDFNLENNNNLNNNLKFEDNSLVMNLTAEQASGKVPFNSFGGLNNLVSANKEIFNLNNLLCNMKASGTLNLTNGIPWGQGNTNMDSNKMMNDLNSYVNLIQIQQAQQPNSQIAQNHNQNMLFQSLLQAFNLNNPLNQNNIGNNQINNNLTNLLAGAAASNAPACNINNLNFLAQLKNLGNIPNMSTGLQNNFLGGNLNSLNNLGNIQNSPQDKYNIANMLNYQQSFMNTTNNKQNSNNINNNNNVLFPNFGDFIRNNINRNNNKNIQVGNGVLNNFSCLGNMSNINFNNPNENYKNFILENKPKADISKITTLNNNDIINNFANINQTYLSGIFIKIFFNFSF
jgi:hypothetical protein